MVAGILPREFRMFRALNREPDVYMPLALERDNLSREDHSRNMYARLRPGVTLGQAHAELHAIARRLEQDFPATNSGLGVRLLPLPRAFAECGRSLLLTLLAAVTLVLCIACVTARPSSSGAGKRAPEGDGRPPRNRLRPGTNRAAVAHGEFAACSGGRNNGLPLAVRAAHVLDARITHMQVLRMHAFRIGCGSPCPCRFCRRWSSAWRRPFGAPGWI